jgi:hypothetical protein
MEGRVWPDDFLNDEELLALLTLSAQIAWHAGQIPRLTRFERDFAIAIATVAFIAMTVADGVTLHDVSSAASNT